MIDLKAIEARLHAATKGPWTNDDEVIQSSEGIIAGLQCQFGVEQDHRNAEFIAHSWEDVRNLLAHIQSLEKKDA